MKKNLKYLIIGGTAVASVIIVAAPIAVASKAVYEGNPLEEVNADLGKITNAAFAQGTYNYKTTFADLKQKVEDAKSKNWNVDGLINFFETTPNGVYEKVDLTDAKIVVSNIVSNDDSQSFDVFFYVESTKKPKFSGATTAKSDIGKATISFGYKPDFDIAAFAHDVTRSSFTKGSDDQNKVNPDLLTVANKTLVELTPAQDFEADVNMASSSDDAIAKLSKYFNISSIFDKIKGDAENQITTSATTNSNADASTTTPSATQGAKTTQDASVTSSEQRYKVTLIKDPNSDKYVTLVNSRKSAKIFLQTEFSDSFKQKFEGLNGIDSKHTDVLEIPLAGVFASPDVANQFSIKEFQASDYYTTPTTGETENKIDLKKQNALDWIFAYNSFFFPNKANKDAYAKIYINSSLEQPLSLNNLSFKEKDGTPGSVQGLGLKAMFHIDGDSLGLENKGGKVVATASGTVTVSSQNDTKLFTKDFNLTLDNFKSSYADSQLTHLFTSEETVATAMTVADKQQLLFHKDKKNGDGKIDYNSITTALNSNNLQDVKNLFTNPTTTNVRFYKGERLAALTSDFTLPTDEQIRNEFSLDTSKVNKENGVFNIKSTFLPTDLSVSRYYFTLANKGLDVAASQFLKVLEAAGIVDASKVKELDTTKPIFKQLQSITLKDVDAESESKGQGPDNRMKVFMINQENQEKDILLPQSVLVNIKDDAAYKLIGENPDSDYQVLKSIIESSSDEFVTNRLDGSKLTSFQNVAQLLIAMYNQVHLLSTINIGFPLLPIGKNVKLNYGITFIDETAVTKNKLNNFKYQYTLSLVDNNGNNKQTLYSSKEDSELLKNISVSDGVEDAQVVNLNQITKGISPIYSTVWVSKDVYEKLNSSITANNVVDNVELTKLGLNGLNDYLKSIDSNLTLKGDTTPVSADAAFGRYKVLSLVLALGDKKATQSIKIFVYQQTKNKSLDDEFSFEKKLDNDTNPYSVAPKAPVKK